MDGHQRQIHFIWRELSCISTTYNIASFLPCFEPDMDWETPKGPPGPHFPCASILPGEWLQPTHMCTHPRSTAAASLMSQGGVPPRKVVNPEPNLHPIHASMVATHRPEGGLHGTTTMNSSMLEPFVPNNRSSHHPLVFMLKYALLLHFLILWRTSAPEVPTSTWPWYYTSWRPRC